MSKMLRISNINDYTFCPMYFWLRSMGYKPVFTNSMNHGRKAHSYLEEKIGKLSNTEIRRRLPGTIAGELPPFKTREVPVSSRRYGFYGKIDEVQASKGTVRIVEDKKASKPYEGNVLQVLAYGVAFQETFGDYDPILVLRNTENGMEIWESRIAEEKLIRLSRLVSEMKAIRDGELRPKPTTNENKCRACSLGYACNRFRHKGTGL